MWININLSNLILIYLIYVEFTRIYTDLLQIYKFNINLFMKRLCHGLTGTCAVLVPRAPKS
jgi:hypothetical protein